MKKIIYHTIAGCVKVLFVFRYFQLLWERGFLRLLKSKWTYVNTLDTKS